LQSKETAGFAQHEAAPIEAVAGFPSQVPENTEGYIATLFYFSNQYDSQRADKLPRGAVDFLQLALFEGLDLLVPWWRLDDVRRRI